MNVVLTVWFLDASKGNRDEIVRAAEHVTTDRKSIVHSVDDDNPLRHRVEFTMTTMAQYAAVPLISQAVRLCCHNRTESAIGFPKKKTRTTEDAI